MPKIITNPEKIDEILDRGTIIDILPTKKEFREKLLSGEKLRFYIGADPTAKALHLGHAQNLMILEDFRKLGHEVIFLIGDFTGMIGDPTDKSAARVRQTREDVKNNFKGWLEQVKNILSFEDKGNPVKVKYNSEWLSKLNFEQVIDLASNFTVQQMLERDMFQKRIFGDEEIRLLLKNSGILRVTHKTYVKCQHCNKVFPSPIQFTNNKAFDTSTVKNNTTNCSSCKKITVFDKKDLIQIRPEPIYLHEFLYPLMQGYDSVAMDVNVELCGSDQIFNALAGRTLMRKIKNKNKFVIATKLIADEKTGMLMSKSNGTGIFLDLNSNDLFGAIMSQPDGMIKPLFLGCTRISTSEVEKLMSLNNPREAKAKLARENVDIYYPPHSPIFSSSSPLPQKNESPISPSFSQEIELSVSPSEAAEEEFNKIFRDKGIPSEIPEIKIDEKELSILDLLVKTKLAPSKSEAKRLVEGKAVEIDGKIISDWKTTIEIKNGMIIRAGKRKFAKIII